MCQGTNTFLLLWLFYQIFSCEGGANTNNVHHCKEAGCAQKVTHVHCKGYVTLKLPLPNCSGSPRWNEVCQHDERAFVRCVSPDFEGNTGSIASKRCSGSSPPCDFMIGSPTDSPVAAGSPTNYMTAAVSQEDTSSQPGANNTLTVVILSGALVVAVALVGVLIILLCRHNWKRCSQQRCLNHCRSKKLHSKQTHLRQNKAGITYEQN